MRVRSLVLRSLVAVPFVAGCSATVADAPETVGRGQEALTVDLGALLAPALPYDVVALGNVDYACSDVEGRLLSTGSVTLRHMSVNALAVTPAEPALVAGSDVTLRDGQVTYGGLDAWGSATLERYRVAGEVRAWGGLAAWDGQHGGVGWGTPTDPSTLGPALRSASDVLGWESAVPVTVGADGVLRVSVTSGVHMIRVSSSDLASAGEVQIQGPSSAVVIVDVTGGQVSLTDKALSLAGGLTPEGVLWNAAAATSLTILRAVVPGTVLAPRAHTAFAEGRVDGGLYVASLSANPARKPASGFTTCGAGESGGQVNHHPFRPGASCPATLLGGATAWGVVSRQGVDYVCSDFEGPVAAGGAVRLSHMAVNTVAGTTVALSAGGDVVLRDGHVHGDLEAAGNGTLASYGVDGTLRVAGTLVEGPGSYGAWGYARPSTGGAAAALADTLISASADLAAWSPSSWITLGASGYLPITATGAVEAFEVDGTDLAAAQGLRITAPSSATVLVNVHGTTVAVEEKDVALTGGITPGHVLFNFPSATSLTLRNVAIPGTVLAPHAVVQFREGLVVGGLFVKDLQGNRWGRTHAAAFTCLPGESGGQVNFAPFSCR